MPNYRLWYFQKEKRSFIWILHPLRHLRQEDGRLDHIWQAAASTESLIQTDEKITYDDLPEKFKNPPAQVLDVGLEEENTPEQNISLEGYLQHQKYTKVKRITNIQLGKFKTETWYYSPFPPAYNNIECLYIC